MKTNDSLGFCLFIGLSLLMTACGDSSSGSAGSAGTGGGGGEGGGGCPSGQVTCDGVCIDEISRTLDGDNGIQAAVFDLSCAFSSCHGSDGPQPAGLELSSVSVSEDNLIDVDSTQVPTSVRVNPGDSGASYLMNKLLGENMAPMTQQMPSGGMLCQARLDAILAHVHRGAGLDGVVVHGLLMLSWMGQQASAVASGPTSSIWRA